VDADKQFPHFTPDVKGTYKVTETVAGKSLLVYGGTWLGVMKASDGCLNCHNDVLAPDEFTPWYKTAHVTGVQQKFDGFKGAAFGAACLECHTVGNSAFAKNGGFDDVAAVANWQFGKAEPGHWDSLLKDKPDVGKLAGVQCESCHGPQTSGAHSAAGFGKDAATLAELKASRVSWSSEVCATCHQDLPHYAKPGQWQTSGHADPALTVNATWEGRGVTAAHCGRCHSAQGFAAYSEQLLKGNAGLLVKPDGSAADETYLRGLGLQTASVQPQTCQTCHDPHDATNPSQLRLFDKIAALPNGMTGLTGVGEGAVCMACHNTRNGEHNDFVPAPTSYSGPHAPAQTDVMYGFNAYFMPRYTPSKHLAIADTCATCHVKIPTAGQTLVQQTANHSFKPDKTVCATCHSKLVTGEPLQAAVAMQLDDLKATIAGQVKGLVVASQAVNGKIAVRAWQPTLDVYSSAKDPTIDLADAPTSVELTSIHGSFGFILHMPKAVQAVWTTGATESIVNVYVAGGDMVTKPASGTATKLVAADSTVAKSVWNYQLLTNDGTKGIHNPTFFQGVIAATKAALLSGK
jgi:predicted CXXCH cytochrome family protein